LLSDRCSIQSSIFVPMWPSRGLLLEHPLPSSCRVTSATLRFVPNAVDSSSVTVVHNDATNLLVRALCLRREQHKKAQSAVVGKPAVVVAPVGNSASSGMVHVSVPMCMHKNDFLSFCLSLSLFLSLDLLIVCVRCKHDMYVACMQLKRGGAISWRPLRLRLGPVLPSPRPRPRQPLPPLLLLRPLLLPSLAFCSLPCPKTLSVRDPGG
jgi:hypothetical protein